MRERKRLKFVAIVAVVTGVLLSGLAMSSLLGDAAKPMNWTDPVQISTSYGLWLRTSDDALYSYGSGSLNISHDAGSSWSIGVPLQGMITVVDDVIYRVNETGSAETQILFSKSLDNGTSWSPGVEVMDARDNDGGYGIYLLDSALVVYSYIDAGTSYGMINASTSLDFGVTWSTPGVVDPLVYVEDPVPSDIVSAGGKMFLSYFNSSTAYEVVVIESEDGGLTWTNRQVVAEGILPQMKESMGELYLTYIGNLLVDPALYFIKSSDGGATWSAPVVIGAMAGFSDPSIRHSLAASNGLVVAAYVDYDSTGPANYVRIVYSDDDGLTWQEAGDATAGDGTEEAPSVAISGGLIHLTWLDGDGLGNFPTYYASVDAPTTVIPEFGSLALSVVGLAIILAWITRRSRK